MTSTSTLEQLENEFWGEPTFDSHVVTGCHRIRKIPLQDLTDENLRLAIGQKMGLRYLLPLAIQRLQADPFTPNTYYEGDLFKLALRLPDDIWREYPDLRAKLVAIADRFFLLVESLEESWHSTCEREIRADYDRFMAMGK